MFFFGWAVESSISGRHKAGHQGANHGNHRKHPPDHQPVTSPCIGRSPRAGDTSLRKEESVPPAQGGSVHR